MSDDPEIVNLLNLPDISEEAQIIPTRVVGIGASAGGLEAFSELLRYLPKNTGMAFVFVQHLEPKQTSRLTEILSRITEMLVEMATEGLQIEPNRVYVMPPELDITLLDGTLQFAARTDSAGHHLRVDYFFRSLAKVQGSKAVAVILSGMGSDGTAGLKAIKENGGTTFAQDEPSAQHHSMAHGAIDSGYVDVVTTPRKIAAELARLARNRPPKSRKRPRIAESVIQDLTDLQRLKQDVVAISEEEQRRFGRDLHDSHCQDLTAISFFAESIAASLDAKDPDSAGQIRTLGEMVRKSAEGLHMLAASLSSQNVEQLGLIKALEELASRTSQRFGVACAVKADREYAIRDNVLAVHLYRIAQEAMSNAARHSQAKGIDIKVRLEGERGILKIADDGVGFSVEGKAAGLGLRTMEYRASVVRGALKIVSRPGFGTVVTCSFPIPSAK